MTETTMQGEKKKIDEKQTRDRKNVITILLMLAIATTGTTNSFTSKIREISEITITSFTVFAFYKRSHIHTQIAHNNAHRDRYGKFVC